MSHFVERELAGQTIRRETGKVARQAGGSGWLLQGETVAKFGDGISVGGADDGEYGPVRVLSPTRAVADLVVADDADLEGHTLVVRTGSERISRPRGRMTRRSACVSTFLTIRFIHKGLAAEIGIVDH